MNELNENEKIAGIIIGSIALLIIIPYKWNNYQEYQQRESARKTCEEIKKQITELRQEVVDGRKKGNKVNLSTVAAAYHLESITNSIDCNLRK